LRVGAWEIDLVTHLVTVHLGGAFNLVDLLQVPACDPGKYVICTFFFVMAQLLQ